MSATGERGATLIEVMVALAILALAGAIVYPTMDRGFAQMQFRRAAEQLSADLRGARGLALTAGRPVALVLSGDGGGYDPGTGAARRAVDGITLSGTPRVTFFADGSTSGGAIALVAARGTRRAEVTVDVVTGAVALRGL
ncbi:GspH/FimT family pseudopilin [Zavarzinia aquatilis]|nr:GspH/FimT family pseudopilin [Zavarzinia aquatilis]